MGATLTQFGQKLWMMTELYESIFAQCDFNATPDLAEEKRRS